MHLGLLVEGGAGRRLAARHEALARLLRRVDGVRPRAMQLQDLRPMHEAVAAERDEVRLGVTPVGERSGPLLRPAQVEHLLARLDHAAVDGAGDHLRHLVGGHRDHDFVEQAHSLDVLCLPDQRPALKVARKRHQIYVTEPLTDLCRLAGDRVSALPVPLDRMLESRRHQQVPPLRAITLPTIVEQPACTREPAAGAGELAAVQQDEDEPARASHGPLDLIRPQKLVVGAFPHVDAVLVSAHEVGGRGQAPEVLRLERGLAIGG